MSKVKSLTVEHFRDDLNHFIISDVVDNKEMINDHINQFYPHIKEKCLTYYNTHFKRCFKETKIQPHLIK